MLYRNFETAAQLEEEYNPAPNPDLLQGVLADYDSWSKAARRDLPCELDISFGPTDAEYLDVFPAAEKNAPVAVFIHGGYWHLCSAKDFSFVAIGLRAAGFLTIVVNYGLCPNITIPDISAQNRAAVAWAYENAARFGSNKAQIALCGHSVGGHQVGMLTALDWMADARLPPDVIKAGMSISGLFDIEPVQHIYLKDIIDFSAPMIEAQSPIKHIRAGAKPPLRLFAGAQEPPEWHRQSAAFAAAYRAKGGQATAQSIEGTDHFTVINELNTEGSRLAGILRGLLE